MFINAMITINTEVLRTAISKVNRFTIFVYYGIFAMMIDRHFTHANYSNDDLLHFSLRPLQFYTVL